MAAGSGRRCWWLIISYAVRLNAPLLILTAFATSCGAPDDSDKYRGVTTQVAAFETGLDLFRRDCGRYPSTAENLAALVTRPTDIPEARWHGPYFERIPLDLWGRAYAYRCPGVHDTNRFDLYSCGPDGLSKTGGDDPDDVSIWKLRRRAQ